MENGTFSSLYSQKTTFIILGFRMLIFPHLGLAPDIGGIEVRTPRTWLYFSKMNKIFGGIFGPPWHEGEKWYGDVQGTSNLVWGQTLRIYKNSNLSLHPLFDLSGGSKWMKIRPHFFLINFWRQKKI